MSTPQRLVEMILRGKNQQFQTVLGEELRERAAILMEKIHKSESQNLIKIVAETTLSEIVVPDKPQTKVITNLLFEKTYKLKDGNIGVLTEEDREMVSKLYKNLNNDNKERMVKLLSESQQTFNRVLNLARLENKKQGSKNG
jgi:hypothetical protein